MPAFAKIDDRYDSGLFGTAAFGTTYFGGPDWPPYPLPDLIVPADNLAEDYRYFPAEIVHRRDGVVVGSRAISQMRRWRVVFKGVESGDVDELFVFWELRRFYLYQDADETGRIVTVFWPGDFNPVRRRGGTFDFDFILEESL